jgi:hypothetical protein
MPERTFAEVTTKAAFAGAEPKWFLTTVHAEHPKAGFGVACPFPSNGSLQPTD